MGKLTKVIESLARPGLHGLLGRRLERKFRDQLAAYFRVLGRHVVALGLEKAAEAATAETGRHMVESALTNPLRVTTPLLKTILEVNLANGILQSQKIHHFAEADDSQDDDSQNDPLVSQNGPFVSPTYITGQEAALYASVRAGELVKGINDTTKQRIADAVSTGIEDRLGVDGTAQLLRQVLNDMVASRARMIASTEMNDAFSEATMRKLDRMDVEWKQWITAGACCDECAENEDASPIPIDEEFPSGDQRPPAHPNCRCALSGARGPAAA